LRAASAEELIGQPITRFIHPDFLPIVSDRLKNLLNQGVFSQPMEEVYLRVDGTPLDVEANSSVIIYKGQPAFQSIIADISERKKAEVELKRIDQLKTDFIAIASHELRNPLTSIDLGVKLVLDRTAGEINAKQEEFLHTAEHGIDRLKSLVNDLLDISKLEAKKVTLKPLPVDLVKAAEDIIATLKLPSRSKKDRFGSDDSAGTFISRPG